MENLNTRPYLEKVKQQLFEQLRSLENVPSVPFHEVPRALDIESPLSLDEQPQAMDGNAKERDQVMEGTPVHVAEFYD